MPLKILILTNLLVLSLTGCAAARPMDPDTALARLTTAWRSHQHTVWEIDWPAAPSGGLLTVEIWRAGAQYRFEILESTAPALVGQMLVFDGQTAWRSDRFEEKSSWAAADPPELAPVSEAFAVIERLLARPAASATLQQSSTLRHGPAEKITLSFSNGDLLAMWLDQATGLPARAIFSYKGSQADLQARQLEPLAQPPAKLFAPNQ